MATSKNMAAALRRLFSRRRVTSVLLGFFFLVLSLWIALQVAVRVCDFDDAGLRHLDVSSVIADHDGKFLRAYLSRDDRWRLPADLDNVAPAMVKATVATEDKRYYEHHGIDWIAVARAAWANLASGRIVSGASTISMQVAGFAIDSRERTLSRKLHQAFLAMQIERHWSKREILESYLTHASYGGNICGVEAAARRYFNKTAADLTVGEASLLAGLPQSPERYRPDRHLSDALSRRSYVLQRMIESGDLTLSDASRIKREGISVGEYSVPVRAPHFCDEIRERYPRETYVRTTLDTGIQTQAERLLVAAVDKNRNAGVTNGSVVVLQNTTGAILAMVGSADYWNRFDDGQVNAALAFRSPGSALKPFIYARALDDDLLTPDETLFDVPKTYSGYAPENYDRQFRGPVPAMKALAWSLNIPAIEVLQKVGVAEFRDFLTKQSVSLDISPFGDPGLSLAIGTCSVRLLDLARAYASLANGGQILPAKWRKSGDSHRSAQSEHHRWISKEAADVILNALADDKIRDPQEVEPSLIGLTGVAWKTGTSNGFRDAWTFAVTRDYTVGVWMGNMDGHSGRGLVGSKAAAPVALTLVAKLKGHEPANWPDASKDIVMADACPVTGIARGPNCPVAVKARFMSGHDHRLVCNVHKSVEIDKLTDRSLCTRCSYGHQIEKVDRAVFSSEVASWLRANNYPWTDTLKPPHNPDCVLASRGTPPSIIMPARGSDIILLSELPSDQQQIALTARAADPSEKLFWFVNGTLAGVAKAGDSLLVPSVPGRHRVVCMDEQGNSTESWYTVERSDRVEKMVKWSRLSDSN